MVVKSITLQNSNRFYHAESLESTDRMNCKTSIISTLFCACVIVIVVGCGPKLQKAGGVVKVDGVPVKQGTVTFYPAVEGRSANAQIGEDGSFTISFDSLNDGLPAGEYKVAIIADIFKPNTKAMEQEAEMKKRVGSTDDVSMVGAGELIHIVPPEYNDVRTTPLKQTVASGGGKQQFEYDISSKKKK